MLGHWTIGSPPTPTRLKRSSTRGLSHTSTISGSTIPRLSHWRAIGWTSRLSPRPFQPAGRGAGFSDGVTSLELATWQRTFVPTVLPRSAVGHVFPLAFLQRPGRAALLQCAWSSLIMDYLARQKLSGSHMSFGVMNQIATPRPAAFKNPPEWSTETLDQFVRARVLELAYTSDRIRSYAEDVVGGMPGAPFRWIPQRRDQVRAELEAAMCTCTS